MRAIAIGSAKNGKPRPEKNSANDGSACRRAGTGANKGMPHLGSWIRDSDNDNFARFLAPHSEITLSNARLRSFDLATLDGLLVTGGPDISAEFHPEPPPDPALIQDPEPERDAWEFAAVRAAYERGLPIFAICKGVQVLNVALGGTLHFDIAGHNLPEMKLQNVQPLRFDASARHRFEHVNSSHHQALDRVAAPLAVEAWHAGDDVIEQVRLRDYPWGLGVQYHPERDLLYTPLFEDFFAQLSAR
jgi:putative glutamine amidotransferase